MSETDFLSIHQYPVTINGVSCTGWKNQFNTNRMTPDGDLVTTGINYYDSSLHTVIGEQVKFFVPKGTIMFALNVYVTTDGECCALSRFGQPPDLSNLPGSHDPFLTPEDYPEYFPVSQYPNGREDLWNGKTLDELKTNDWYAELEGGHITIVNHNGTATTEHQWLYVQFLQWDGSTFCDHRTTLVMNWSQYQSWYSTTEWLANGDPDLTDIPVDPIGTVTVSPTALAFGYVESGSDSVKKYIRITNGTDVNQLITWTLPTGFETTTIYISLIPDQTYDFGVTFSPTEEKAYSGYLEFTAQPLNETIRVYLSGTATTDLPGDDTESDKRKSNPFLVYGSNGDLYLFYDIVTHLKLDGSEITNIYYVTSSDHGETWSLPNSVTSIENYGIKYIHPTAALGDDGKITLSYYKQFKSLCADWDTYGWCGSGLGCGSTCDLHFDKSTGNLFVYNINTSFGIKPICSIVVINTTTWYVEKCYSSQTSPSYNDIFSNNYVLWHRQKGDGKYATVGISGLYAFVINHESNDIVEYYFTSNDAYNIDQNVDVDFRGRIGNIAAIQIDDEENKIYILFIHTYVWTGTTLIFGYIDLTETKDQSTGKYKFNEIFYAPSMTTESIGMGFNSMVVNKSADLIILAFAGSGAGLWIYSLSSGSFIKSYTINSHSGFPYNGAVYPVWYDNHIYAHFTYTSSYGQEDRRGLLDINLLTDNMTYITPTYAAGVDNFRLWRKVATGDGRLVISTQGFGIQIFDINSGIWTSYNNDTVPGLTPDGCDVFFDVEYDPETGNIFAAAGSMDTAWHGVVMFNESGNYLQTNYRIGNFTDNNSYGNESVLTQGMSDYDMSVIRDYEDKLWGVWSRKDSNELSLKWDVDEASKDITPYLTGTTTVDWDIDSISKLNFSVSHGHLFDATNLSSTLSPILKKGRLLFLQMGELISGVDTLQAQGFFIVTEKSLTYKRGEYPVMSVQCQDVRYLWDQATITATEFYDNADPSDVLYDLVSTHANLDDTQIDLPSALSGSHTIDHQWVDTKLLDCIKDITDHFGYFPFIDVNGNFTIRLIDLDAETSHAYTTPKDIIGFSPDDSYGTMVNLVIVKGEGRYFIEVSYAEEMMTSDSGTMGWWGCEETRRYYFSDDHKSRARNPRLANVVSPTINVLFVEKGGGEVSISTIDADGYYIDVFIAAPDMILVVVSSIAALLVMAAVAMTCTLNCGYYIFACMVLVSVVFYLLAAVANYSFEVYACPIGSEKQTFQAESDDLDLQRELGVVIKEELDDPFCYDVASCQTVADKEMAIVKAQRKRVTFEKISHLQDEVGDIIQIIHPYSGQSLRIFVTGISRSYTKPDGTGDGGMIDNIEGWWLG